MRSAQMVTWSCPFPPDPYIVIFQLKPAQFLVPASRYP